MTTKYKLRITMRLGTLRKPLRPTGEYIWDNKEDALACKSLMEKAKTPSWIDISFVEFTEEIPL